MPIDCENFFMLHYLYNRKTGIQFIILGIGIERRCSGEVCYLWIKENPKQYKSSGKRFRIRKGRVVLCCLQFLVS